MSNRPASEEYARMVEEGLKSGEFDSGTGSKGMQAAYGREEPLSTEEKALNEKNKNSGKKSSGPLSSRLNRP